VSVLKILKARDRIRAKKCSDTLVPVFLPLMNPKGVTVFKYGFKGIIGFNLLAGRM
jgi:hypothetical protein